MHLERRSSPGQIVSYPNQVAALRANAFGDHPTLEICWGEPPDSNLLLDILCDRSNSDLAGQGGKGSKNDRPRVQILHVVYETSLPSALSAANTSRFMRSCIQQAFRHNLCGVHSDLYPGIVNGLLELRRGLEPAKYETRNGVTLYYPMEAGDQPHLIILDMNFCPDIRMEGE